ncbi:caspase, EACC1-associated type [Streptomyces galilaeus]|uniref:caspase, EACC1-associated type n=1 Tax=Streptomyces galilaeus TaxID=33899 RepID=UPI0038F73A62
MLIGIDDYAHADLPAMPAAAAGARHLAGLLRDPSVWGLAEEHVTVIGSTTPVEQVLGAVRDAALGAEDTLVVYFAGHGLRDRSERLYLALTAADADYPQIGTLPYLQLRDVIRQSGYRAKHRVTVLDCCYSGIAGGMSSDAAPSRTELARALEEPEDSSGEGDDQEGAEDRYGDCVLTSAPPTRRSFVLQGARFPEFTGELIDILETGIPGADVTVSLETTWRRVHNRMRRRGSPEPQQFAQNAVTRHLHLRNRAVPEPADEPETSSQQAPDPDSWDSGGTDLTVTWQATVDAQRPPSPDPTTTRTTKQPGHERRSSRLCVPGAPVTLFDSRDTPLGSVAFNPSGTLLASASEDGTVRLWELATQKCVRSLPHQVVNPWAKPLAEVLAFNPRFSAALSVAFSPDGTDLAVGNGDGTVSLWDVADGSETVLPYLDGTQWNGSVASVCFSPAGAMLAATYDAPAIRLWDVATRTSMATLATGDAHWVAQVAFSPCGQVLASASGNGNPNNTVNDGLLQLWDTSSGADIATLTETNSPAGQPLAFSSDGKTLASLRRDGRITLWDIAARKTSATITGPSSGVTCVAFGHDGVLAGGFLDGTVTLWDTVSSRSIAVLTTGTNSAVSSLAFSPDGAFLASATRKLTVWPLATDSARVLGPDHPDTLHARAVGAINLGKAGEHAEAARLLAEVAADRARVLGPDHPDTLNARGDYASNVGGTGEHAEAARLHAELAADRARVLGPDHYSTLLTRHHHAWELGEAGEHAESARLYAELATDSARVLGPDHPDTLNARAVGAINLGKAGEHAEAARLLAEVAADRARVLGPDHPDTLNARSFSDRWSE